MTITPQRSIVRHASAWYATFQISSVLVHLARKTAAMATATLTTVHRTVESTNRSTILARILAALDRACASSADGVRGL